MNRGQEIRARAMKLWLLRQIVVPALGGRNNENTWPTLGQPKLFGVQSPRYALAFFLEIFDQ
jgi:hypothetical protein